ncbi:hypothetical protein [Halobacillus halophilus]|uniref:hypothetical protein n=1 Tax=Halobacillus halophilus TaxID=1570 RepID=UPI001CD7EEE4|nr:hypothetical protein [Halobacillus halophilus]MCA1010765.1 hypothetical protein [Halobacillus halophilus]
MSKQRKSKMHKRDMLDLFFTWIPELIFAPVRFLKWLGEGFVRIVSKLLDAI